MTLLQDAVCHLRMPAAAMAIQHPNIATGAYELAVACHKAALHVLQNPAAPQPATAREWHEQQRPTTGPPPPPTPISITRNAAVES